MIMPCMNATSACDLGGSSAVADGGSLLLGIPGAPGWTTTGFAGPVCARTARQKRPVGAVTARNRQHNRVHARADRSLSRWERRYCEFGTMSRTLMFDESRSRNTNIFKDFP